MAASPATLAPLCALLLAACGDPQGDAAWAARFAALHRPVYDVFSLVPAAGDSVDRDALWDRLARTYADEALTAEYIGTFANLERMAREGTRIRVARVAYDVVDVVDGADGAGGEPVTLDVAWSAGGTVAHATHRHVRVNAYEARFDLALVEQPGGAAAAWRIVDVRMRDARRLGRDDARAATEGAYLDPLDLLDLLDAAEPSAPLPGGALP